MKLTRTSKYAICALVALARQDSKRFVASHLLAAAAGVPQKFLLKVLKPLVDAKVLRAFRGVNGGYRLVKPALDITLLEVVETVEGPIRGVVPEIEGSHSGFEQKLQAVCQQAAEQLRAALRSVRLSDLVSGSSQKK